MINPILQLISDEIICYKKAIEDIEDKIKLLAFLNGVDGHIGKSLNLDKKELTIRRDILECKLQKLFEKRNELTQGRQPTEEIEKINTNKSAVLMSIYLSMVNNIDCIEKHNASKHQVE